MKIWIHLFSIVLGVLLGWAVMQLHEPSRSDVQEQTWDQDSPARTWRQSTHSMASSAVESLHQSLGLNRDLSHHEAREVLHSQGASPLRSQSFLNYRIHFLDLDQLREELAAGNLTTRRDAIAAAQRLAEYDLEEALEIYCSRKWKLSLDNLYAFRNELTRIAVSKDAVMALRALQSLKRGGGQMDWALWMSREWSNTKPHEAAQYFDELVRVRNVKMGRYKGDYLSGPDYQTYANMIVKSWYAKQPDELFSFVANLPAGPQKNAFNQVLKKLPQTDR